MNRLKESTIVVVAIAAGAFALSLAAPAEAAFVLLDDFEGATVDTVVVGQTSAHGQTWAEGDTSENAAYVVRSVSGNTVLAHEGSSADNIALPFGSALNIADNTKGTLFFRVQPANLTGSDFALAIADDPTPDMPFGGNSDKTAGVNFGANGLSGGDGFTMTADTSYLVWVEADLTDGSEGYNIFVQAEGDTTRTQVTDTANGLPFALRDYDNVGLSSIYFKNNGSNGGNAKWYFDDFYIDNTGFNSANPIPEPASLAMGLVGLTLLAMRRSRPA